MALILILIPDYYHEGFLFLQIALDESIVKSVSSQLESFNDEFNILLNRYPYPPYIDDNFIVALQGWLPLIFMLSFIYPTINITKNIVHEKEKRLKVAPALLLLQACLKLTSKT